MAGTTIGKLRCIQTWGFDDYIDVEHKLLREQLDDEDDDISETKPKYASQMYLFKKYYVLSFEMYRKSNFEEAFKYLKHAASSSDDFILQYPRVFTHAIKASAAHIFLKLGSSNDEANKIASKLNDEVYTEAEEAAFNYLKCVTALVYGNKDNASYTKLMESAIKTVPDEAEFHYLLGIILHRTRHESYPPPKVTTQEFDALKRAVSLKKDSVTYVVALGQVYMDMRFTVPKHKRAELSNIAAKIYRNLLEHSDSLRGCDIARCIFNIMKHEFDPSLEKYAKIAKLKSNKVITNHYIGIFYARNHQYQEALDCWMSVVGTLPYLTSTILLMVYRLNNNEVNKEEVNLCIEKLSQIFNSAEDSKKVTFFLGLSEYFLIVEDDLISAARYLIEANNSGDLKDVEFRVNACKSKPNYLIILRNALNGFEETEETITVAKKIISSLSQEKTFKYMPKCYVTLSELQQNLI